VWSDAVGEIDRQGSAPAILVDRHRNKNGLAGDDLGFAHLFVAPVEDQIGVALVEPPPGKRVQSRIKSGGLVDRADR
jgi:hypothetical protein